MSHILEVNFEGHATVHPLPKINQYSILITSSLTEFVKLCTSTNLQSSQEDLYKSIFIDASNSSISVAEKSHPLKPLEGLHLSVIPHESHLSLWEVSTSWELCPFHSDNASHSHCQGKFGVVQFPGEKRP